MEQVRHEKPADFLFNGPEVLFRVFSLFSSSVVSYRGQLEDSSPVSYQWATTSLFSTVSDLLIASLAVSDLMISAFSLTGCFPPCHWPADIYLSLTRWFYSCLFPAAFCPVFGPLLHPCFWPADFSPFSDLRLALSLTNWYQSCFWPADISPFSARRKTKLMKLCNLGRILFVVDLPSANPVWRILVLYIPSMYMMVLRMPLASILRQRRCSLLYDVYWLAWCWLMFNGIKIPGIQFQNQKMNDEMAQ